MAAAWHGGGREAEARQHHGMATVWRAAKLSLVKWKASMVRFSSGLIFMQWLLSCSGALQHDSDLIECVVSYIAVMGTSMRATASSAVRKSMQTFSR